MILSKISIKSYLSSVLPSVISSILNTTQVLKSNKNVSVLKSVSVFIVNFGDICEYFCMEILLLMGIILTPWIMIYVFIRQTRILRKYLYVQIHTIYVENKKSVNEISFSKKKSSMDSKIWQYRRFVCEKVRKYAIQLVLLQFSYCFFNAIPQLIIQLYVFFDDEYGDVYASDVYAVVFCVSIVCSVISVLKFCQQCCCNGRNPIEVYKEIFM